MGILNFTPDQGNSLLNFGTGLLSASGPAPMPTSFGQALAAGVQNMQAGDERSEARKIKTMQIEMMRQQHEALMRAKEKPQLIEYQAPDGTRIQEFVNPEPGRQFGGKPEKLPDYQIMGQDGKPMLNPLYMNMLKQKAAMGGDRGAQPFYNFLPTDKGYVVGNARTGEMSPGAIGGNPVIRSTDSPALQGELSRVKASGKETGETTTKAALDLNNVVAQGEEAISLTDKLIAHPGRTMATGASSLMGVQKIPGTKAHDFMVALKQVKGKQFLQAFNVLKGGGQITEIEGQKATDAMSRMDNAGSEGAFVEAAEDFKNVIRAGIERAKVRAEPAPQAQPAPGASYGGVNPSTGRMEYFDSSGRKL